MPYKDTEKQREYLQKYCSQRTKDPIKRKHKSEKQNERRKKKKQQLIEHLGGKCCGCGISENLQFDHIDRTQKQFVISEIIDWHISKIIPEVNKCQLLCSECHNVKTRANYDYEKLLKGYSLKSIVNTGGEITITYQISNETQ
jgi:hypothetical protein